MKKLKLIIFAAAIVLFITGTNLTHAFEVDSTKYVEYSEVYSKDQIKSSFMYDDDYMYTDCYYNYSMPLSVDLNKQKYLYLYLDLGDIDYQISDFIIDSFLKATIDNEYYFIKAQMKNDGSLESYNIQILDHYEDYLYFYKLDFSNLGDNHYLTNLTFTIPYKYDKMNSNEELDINQSNIDLSYTGSAKYEYDNFYKLYFDSSFSASFDFYFVDQIKLENDKINIYLINNYVFENLKKVKIDNNIYEVQQDPEYLNHYYLSKEDSNNLINNNGNHTFNMTELIYTPTTLVNGSNVELEAIAKCNEQFTYTTTKKYVETNAISLVNVDDPLIGFTNTYVYSALFNSVHGRIENAKKVKLNFTHSNKKSLKNATEYTLEYDISYNNEIKNQDKIGTIRKLEGNERLKASWEPSFVEKLALKVQGIELATFQYDYEFKVQGYLKDNKLNYCSVIYEVEEGSLYYGSFYKNALNWDDSGVVFDGNGNVQSNLKFDGTNIINTSTGKVVEPENNNITTQQKSRFYEVAIDAVVDGQQDFWNKVKELFSNIKTGANKAAIIAAAIVGVLFVVLFIKLLRWIFKK